LETDLLNLSNPEKSVVSAGKLFHMLTIRMLKTLRLLKVKSIAVCVTYMRDRVIVTGFLEWKMYHYLHGGDVK